MSMDTLAKTSKTAEFLEPMQETYRGEAPGYLKNRSLDAAEVLRELEFPTSKTEYYKYTRTGRIANKSWKFDDGQSVADVSKLPVDLESMKHRLVFVNGKYAPSLSSPTREEGITLTPMSEAPDFDPSEFGSYLNHRTDIFTALNAAMPQDGFYLHVDKNVSPDEPIHVINVFDGDHVVAQPRSFARVAQGSKVMLTEYQIHLGDGPTFGNSLMEVHVEPNASFGIDTIQMGHEESYMLEQIDAVQERDSHFIQNYFTLSGNWTRNNSNCRIVGENAECNFNGFYIPNGREHIDNHTIIDHEKPHCNSNELYRGVLLDKSTGVFNGKVYVRQDAQKTNAFQSNGNIVVSDTATINSKPELEIYADDVKCSHGSTTGQLDEEALYYLQSRGLSYASARRMLIEAFAQDVLEKLVNDDLVSLVEKTIHHKLIEAE